MKILCVGDVHNRAEVLVKSLILADQHKVDKVILMGDYVDDWEDSSDDTKVVLGVLNEVIEDPRVIALLGNHELSYLEDQRCGGWSASKAIVFNKMFQRSKFSLSYQYENWLFSHAGLLERWRKYANRLNIETDRTNDPVYIQQGKDETYASWLERLWIEYPGIYKSIGPGRGGFGIGSPLWADWEELLENPVDEINQVVGHTPGRDIRVEQVNGNTYVNVDVWSNGGPGGFLLWEDGELTFLDSTGSVEDQAASA